MPNANIKRMVGHTSRVNAITAMEPDGWVATASTDLSVRIWDTRAGTLIGSMIGAPGSPDHSARLLTIVSLPNRLLCSAGDDSKIIVWNTTMLPLPPIKLLDWTAHVGSVRSLCALTSSTVHVISGGLDHGVFIWNVGTGASHCRCHCRIDSAQL
jgi:WD40 repeat protein